MSGLLIFPGIASACAEGAEALCCTHTDRSHRFTFSARLQGFPRAGRGLLGVVFRTLAARYAKQGNRLQG